MVPAGFENAGLPGSPPGVAIEVDGRTTQPCAHRAGLCSFMKQVTEEPSGTRLTPWHPSDTPTVSSVFSGKLRV